MTTTSVPTVGRYNKLDVIPTTATSLQRLGIVAPEVLEAQKKVAHVEGEWLENLRPYQLEDVQFLAARKSGACLNEQRTGKTPTALSVLRAKGLVKNLIICPTSAVFQWKEEYEKWYQAPCIAVHGTAKKRKEQIAAWTHGLVIGYDSLKIIDHKNKETGEYSHSTGDLELVLKHQDIEGVIIDEVHRIKNHKTKTAQAVFKLKNIPHKLVLSGTPAIKEQVDIYSMLHFLYPTIFTSYWKFVFYYFNNYKKTIYIGGQAREITEIGSLSNPKELQEFLEVISTSRKRKDVMPWLPDKDRIVVKLEPTDEQKKYLDELQEFFETEHVVTQGILDRLLRMRQICIHPAVLLLNGVSPKLEWIKQFIKDYPDKSILIFSKFTQWLKILAKELGTNNLIIGEATKQERDRIRKDFQAGRSKLILLQIDAGKEALTLDQADVIIFTDKYPPAGDIAQAEDRFVATTENKADKEHTIYSLVMKNTYEEAIETMISRGANEIDLVNNYKKYLKEGHIW